MIRISGPGRMLAHSLNGHGARHPRAQAARYGPGTGADGGEAGGARADRRRRTQVRGSRDALDTRAAWPGLARQRPAIPDRLPPAATPAVTRRPAFSCHFRVPARLGLRIGDPLCAAAGHDAGHYSLGVMRGCWVPNSRAAPSGGARRPMLRYPLLSFARVFSRDLSFSPLPSLQGQGEEERILYQQGRVLPEAASRRARRRISAVDPSRGPLRIVRASVSGQDFSPPTRKMQLFGSCRGQSSARLAQGNSRAGRPGDSASAGPKIARRRGAKASGPPSAIHLAPPCLRSSFLSSTRRPGARRPSSAQTKEGGLIVRDRPLWLRRRTRSRQEPPLRCVCPGRPTRQRRHGRPQD